MRTVEKAERENGIIEVGAKEEEVERIRKIMRMRIKWRNEEDTKLNEEEVKGVLVFKLCADENYTYFQSLVRTTQ